MPEPMTLWGLPVATWWWQVTLWTVGVFFVVRLVEGRLSRVVSARGRMALYGLVALRLVAPPDWAAPVGVVGQTQAIRAAEPDRVAASTAAAVVSAVPDIELPMLSRTHGTEAVAPTPSPTSPWPWLYLAGVALLLGVFVGRRRGLRQVLTATVPAPTWVQALAPAAGVVVHTEAGPLATGWRRPTIVLPRHLLSEASRETVRCVVAHERAHLQGGDVGLLHGLTLATALAWPIAGIWLAARRVRVLIEEAADARATRTAGIEPRRFARVLLQLVPSARPLTAGVGLGGYGQLRGRLAALAHPVASGRVRQTAWLVGAAVVVVACAGVRPADEPAQARVADCDELLVAATVRHDEVSKGPDPMAFTDVLDDYDAFLDACPAHPDYGVAAYYAAEAQWALATALHNAGDLEASRRQFDHATARFDEALEAGVEMAEDAAYGHLSGTKNATAWAPRESASCEGEGCDDFAFVPYDATDARVLAAWERYAEVVGRPLKSDPAEQLSMATLRMQHNDFDRARPDLQELTIHAAGTEPGLRAAEMLADVLTIAWTRPGLTAEERLRRGDVLDDWLAKIAATDTHDMDGANRLRDAIVVLRKGVEHQRQELR